MYGLMFRTERIDMTRPSLHEAATASFEGLASAVGAGRNEKLTGEALEALSLDQAAAIARAWSLVHGFTTLLLDGRLKDILHRLPEGTGVDQLLDAMLRSTVARRRGVGRRHSSSGVRRLREFVGVGADLRGERCGQRALSNPCKSWFAARALRRLPRLRWAAASTRHTAPWRSIGPGRHSAGRG